MNIEGLVQLLEDYSEVADSLPENVGDGYLLKHNQVYRSVRKQGLACGTTYSSGGNLRWYDYMVFPLVNFDDLVKSKEIPYIDNFNVLSRLSQKYPKLSLPEKFIRDAFKRNYLLHETCHCIAQDYLTNESLVQKSGIESPAMVRLFDSLLGESLANSTEMISSALADDSVHILLHLLNSYVPYSPKSHEFLNKAIDEISLSAFLKLTFVSFFFNNLIGYEHSRDDIEQWIGKFEPHFDFELNDKKRELIIETLENCCRLNPRFRDETSVVFFDSFGMGDEYKGLSAEKISKNPGYIKLIAQAANQLSELILEENNNYFCKKC